MWKDAETRDRRQQQTPGFKDHLDSSLPKRLMVQYVVEITHPELRRAKLNHMEMPKILKAEFLAHFVLSFLSSTGMQWAHEDGMNSDMSARESGTSSLSKEQRCSTVWRQAKS